MREAIAAILLLLIIYLIQSACSEVITLGYSSSSQLPFLENATLRIQPGETLWMTSSHETTIRVRSPNGTETLLRLEGGNPTPVKQFKEDDSPGEWIIIDQEGRTMKIIFQKSKENRKLIYDIVGSYLLVRTFTPTSTLILNPSGINPMYLLVAGTTQSIRLKGNDSVKLQEILENASAANRAIKAKLSYLEKFKYAGWIGNTSYEIQIEPIVGEIPLSFKDATLFLQLPTLHEVGYRGILPLRSGEAILEIRRENKTLQLPVYITDQRFKNYQGVQVGTISRIPIKSCNDIWIEVIYATNSSAEFVRVKPPLTMINLFDQHGKRIKNVTVKTAKGSATVINGTIYILAEKATDPLTESKPAKEHIRVYVNGFKALELEVQPYKNMCIIRTIRLRRLTINLLDQESKPLEGATLSINSTLIRSILGRTTYELPSGVYNIEVKYGWFWISHKIELNRDVELTLRFRKALSLQEALILLAVIETILMAVLALAYLIERRSLIKLSKKPQLIPEKIQVS